jgi:hypothetical protein
VTSAERAKLSPFPLKVVNPLTVRLDAVALALVPVLALDGPIGEGADAPHAPTKVAETSETAISVALCCMLLSPLSNTANLAPVS